MNENEGSKEEESKKYEPISDMDNHHIETDNYLLDFAREIRSLNSTQKMPQIGIEPRALGIKDDVIPLGKINSLFTDFTFEYVEPLIKKQEWNEFSSIQNPSALMDQFPDMTMFFIFYCQIKDKIQKEAYETLLKRGWKYNDNIWTKIENGEKFFFDLKSWSRKKCSDQ